jgi:carbon storage regulator
MLILTRRLGESIRIGDDITVLITGVDQNKVKIGITSPRHIPIYREELYIKIQQENKEAAAVNEGDLDEMLELVAE